jgi:hypothetical protein
MLMALNVKNTLLWDVVLYSLTIDCTFVSDTTVLSHFSTFCFKCCIYVWHELDWLHLFWYRIHPVVL